MDYLVRIDDVELTYKNSSVSTRALRGVGLTINPGEFISISGPSGCGKSTLLSIIGLLLQPTTGKYWIGSELTSQMSKRRRAQLRNELIGFVHQEFHLIDEYTILENVMVPTEYDKNISRSEAQRLAEKVLDRVGILDMKSARPPELSGGCQQLASIARALVKSPKLLLVDEPTGNLDSENGENVMQAIVEANLKGATVCLVTHNPVYAHFAKVSYKMLDGRILGRVDTWKS